MPRPSQKKTGQKKSRLEESATDKTVAATKSNRNSCPIVGIGASAGGLAAFKTFFSHMPSDSGMAFVLVPHLDPGHQSLMVELLARQTEMPVCEANDDISIEPNHVYIIPPAKYLAIQNGRLQLSKPPASQRVDTAIDHFLRTLAVDQEERAIGIILSGTSSHGTLGLQAIKASGGLTMVQQPDTAEYTAMPQNAIDAGIVDYILPPDKMAAALIKYVQHAYVSGAWEPKTAAEVEREQLDHVLELLQAHSKYDFRSYRKNMIMRRVLRRMGVNHIDQLSDYSEFLSNNPDEAKHLLRDLLIGVTGFFRDAEAYKSLKEHVIAHWVERTISDIPLRIWIPACATGEEAYSIAMLLIEQFSDAQKPLNIQIFATDIDEAALEIARAGMYPISIAADIPSKRLSRFFTQKGNHYQVNKQVRELVVFAAQNLISDAPFSKLDLISCRNLLIYLVPEVQRKLISLFHFALKQDGHLFLGSSETVGRHLDLFETVSKKWRIFRRIGPTRRANVEFPISPGYHHKGILPPISRQVARHELNFAELTQRQLLDDYAPASVLINRNYEVLYFQGETGDFLQPPSGEPTRNLVAMARQGLQTRLRSACHKAIHDNQPVSDSSARVKHNGSWLPCSITVKPIIEPKQAEGLLLVTFHKREPAVPAAAGAVTETAAQEESSLVRELEYELKATRDDLQTTIEDMETSNEELKASNEEIMSMNEELQSANEELETSKEELQSLNEELSTVNSQLQDKVEELDKAHNDMTNLLNSADIATLFLDTGFRIRQFTPATGKLLGLLGTDIGRPISTFATDFTSESLLSDARQVLDTLTPVEHELSAVGKRHYMRRVMPYRTADNRIEGLVVSFIDVTQRIKSEQQSRRMATILHDSSDAIAVLGRDGEITAWNRGAELLYGYSAVEALQMNICDLVPADKQADTRQYLQRIVRGEHINSYDSSRLAKDGHILDVWITVTPLYDETGQVTAIATTERDISERRQLDALQVVTDRLQNMVEHLPAGAVYRENDHLVMNRSAEAITGYGRDELATMDQWFTKLYGEHAADIRQRYQREREACFPRQTGPIALTQKNGAQRFIEYAAYKFDDHEVWILHDVTSRHESERALHEREERLRAVMDNAAEAIVVIGTDGVITDFNNAAQTLFGYAAKEAIGHNVSLLMHSPHREQHDGYIARYIRTGEPRIMKQPRELQGRHKNGSTLPLELTVTQIDHIGIFVGIIRDLSVQKTLQRQIADISTREQERIGQDIHDGLGQQLTGLSLLATGLKRNLASRNLPEAALLDEMIAQLQLAISNARALSRGLAPVPVTPEGLKDALSMLAHDISTHTGIECQFEDRHSADIKDRTDAMQIFRIVQEAVNNAVKHAQANHIKITLQGNKKDFEVAVSDDGCGFKMDQVNDESMGIRIMHYRTSIIGCHLEIESSPGKGTTVRCRR